MKKVISYVLVLGLLVAGFSMTTSAFGGSHHERGFNQNRQVSAKVGTNYNANPLELTEEQLDELGDIRDDFFDKREDKREELQETNFDLRELLLNDGSDEKVASHRTKLNNLQSDINNLRINYWKDVKNVLNEEQIAEMNKLQEESGNVGFGIHGGNRSFGPGIKGNGSRLNNNFQNSRSNGRRCF